MTIRYESHINGYSIGSKLPDKLLGLGFSLDPFGEHIEGRTRYMPPHHFTFLSKKGRYILDKIFARAVEEIKRDKKFVGYIESETALENKFYWRDSIINSDMLNSIAFPFPPCKLIVPSPNEYKSADIHLKRSLDVQRDRLDELLLEHNFYEVHTPRNRIFTVQTLSIVDGKIMYGRLLDYFSNVGGLKQIDLEITHGFYRQPYNFPVPELLKKGFFTK